MQTGLKGGMAVGLFAYVIWGLSALYWRQLDHISPMDVISHRAVWTLPIAFLFLVFARKVQVNMIALKNPKTFFAMFAAAFLISANWIMFVGSISIGKLADAGLGYFMLPLVNVILGMILFRERPDRSETIAIIFAILGIAVLFTNFSQFPWIAIGVSVSFGLYGAIRKAAPVDAMGGMFIEALFIAPFAAAWLYFNNWGGLGAFGTASDLLIIGSGLVTGIPLIAYAASARILPMITLGMLFYINPTIQVIIAFFIFDENLPLEKMIAFALVWTGLLVLTIGKTRQIQRTRKAAQSA